MSQLIDSPSGCLQEESLRFEFLDCFYLGLESFEVCLWYLWSWSDDFFVCLLYVEEIVPDFFSFATPTFHCQPFGIIDCQGGILDSYSFCHHNIILSLYSIFITRCAL